MIKDANIDISLGGSLRKFHQNNKLPANIQKVREELLPQIPDIYFKPDYLLLFEYIGYIGICFFLTLQIVQSQNHIVTAVLSIVLGFTSTLALFFVHIFIHGNVLQSKSIRKFLSLPCSYYALISPTFWSHWHHLHHRFGTFEENISGFQTVNFVKNKKLKKLIQRIKPVQNENSSFFYLFFWKAIAFMINQFWFIFSSRFENTVNRYVVAAELSFLFSVHAVAWYFLSWEKILFIEIIPWFIQNLVSSLFVVTNHHPKLILSANSFLNTSSVHLGNRFLNRIFFNIGYHIEHHIFPDCNPRYLPEISDLISKKFSREYKCLSLFSAINEIFFKNDRRDVGHLKGNKKIV